MMRRVSNMWVQRARLVDRRWLIMALGIALCAWAVASLPSTASVVHAQAETPQTILPPGLYLLQTRTRDGSCADAPKTGYVTSTVATLDGVPGSRTMMLQVVNSKYWPSWTITVDAKDLIIGDAVMFGGDDKSKGTSHFELGEKKDRFQGIGSRTYPSTANGKTISCTLNYDVLLKLID